MFPSIFECTLHIHLTNFFPNSSYLALKLYGLNLYINYFSFEVIKRAFVLEFTQRYEIPLGHILKDIVRESTSTLQCIFKIYKVV